MYGFLLIYIKLRQTFELLRHRNMRIPDRDDRNRENVLKLNMYEFMSYFCQHLAVLKYYVKFCETIRQKIELFTVFWLHIDRVAN